MKTMRLAARRGFTMAEMIIAVIIIAILGAAMTRLLVTQAHLFQKAAAQRGTRSVTRSAMNMIDSDLRMVEATNGVVSASSTAADRTVAVRGGRGMRHEWWRDYGECRPSGLY